MSTSRPRKHHTVSAGYVRRFARDGEVITVHHLQRGVFEGGPRGVGYQLDYWGPPDLAQEVEEMFGPVESNALSLLANLRDRWPPDRDDRATLGQFLALHVVRIPSYGGFLRQIGERVSKDTLAEGARKYDLNEQQKDFMADVFRGDRTHVNSLLRQIPRLASLLCSMRWSVVEFDEDWLITGDQPLVLVTPGDEPITPASAVMSPTGAVEARFTLDPRHALLLTWSEEPDDPWLTGDRRHACSINCAITAQTLEEWFSLPETSPPFLVPPVLVERTWPVSPELLPGYTAPAAGESRRRLEAEQLITKMVEEQTPPHEMHWVRVGSVT